MSKISKKITAVLCSFTFVAGQVQLLSLSNVFAEGEAPVIEQVVDPISDEDVDVEKQGNQENQEKDELAEEGEELTEEAEQAKTIENEELPKEYITKDSEDTKDEIDKEIKADTYELAPTSVSAGEIFTYEYSSTSKTATVSSLINGRETNVPKIVTIPSKVVKDGVEYTVNKIGKDVFGDLEFYSNKVSTINIPKTVTYIDSTALSSCEQLKSINMESNSYFYSKDGVLYKKSGSDIILFAYPGDKYGGTFTIPNDVTVIGDYAFSTCNEDGDFGEIVVPNTVTTIGKYAFNFCYSTYYVPKSVVKIGENAFSDVTIYGEPGSYIEQYVKNSSNSNIIFRVRNNNFAYYIENNSAVITAYTGKESIVEIPATLNGYKVSRMEGIGVKGFIQKIIIQNGITTIGEYAFNNCDGLEYIVIPDSVTSIGKGAFKYLNNLKGITLPKNITNYFIENNILYYKENQKIYIDAILNCRDISEIAIKEGVSDIPYVFYTCKNVTKITMPSSVTNMDDMYTFNNCKKLKEINVLSGNKIFYSKDGVLYRNDYVAKDEEGNILERGHALFVCPKSKEGSITIPKEVTYVPERILEKCVNLTSISVEAGNSKYFSKNGLLYEKDSSSGESKLILCPAKISGSITISADVSSLPSFDNCNSLTEIKVDQQNKNYYSVDGVLYEKQKDNYYGTITHILIKCPEGKVGNITIPKEVSQIESNALITYSERKTAYKNLTEIKVEAGNKTFFVKDSILYGNYNDQWNTALDGKHVVRCVPSKSGIVNIDSDVVAINLRAFFNCDKITSVNIPKSMVEMYDYTFRGCSSLQNVNVASGNERFYSENGVLYDKEVANLSTNRYMLTLLEYPEGKIGEKFQVPNGVEIVSPSSFTDHKYLNKLILPKSVHGIYVSDGFSWLQDDRVSKNITLCGEKGSYAQEYALINGLNFEVISADEKPVVKDISTASISSISAQYYTGSQIKPSITVKDGTKTLVNNKDYTLSYSKNINPGTATITIKGMGNYTGSKQVTFTIKQISVNSSDLSVSSISDITYTGSYIKPSVTIKHGSKTLVKDKDYTLSYSNNKYIGKATVTIIGKGNYYSTRKVTFKIIPKTVTGVKQSSNTTSSIKLSWNKVSDVTGYRIYRATSKSRTYSIVTDIVGSTKTTYTNSKLSSGKIYYYKVKSYKTVSGTRYYSNYSSIITASTKCQTPVIKVTSSTKKTAKISWNKISGASGYKVYRATSKSGAYKLVKTVRSGSTTSYTNNELTSKKTYYYKVIAYKIVSGSNVYSSYSSVKYVKVK